MLFPLFWCECNSCGHRFDVQVGPERYEAVVLRSQGSNSPAKLIPREDPMFIEVGNLVRDLLSATVKGAIDRSRYFDFIFGELCDPAPDGTPYDITGRVWCPRCHRRAALGGPHDPPNFATEEIPDVLHTHWDGLSPLQRRERVRELLEEKKGKATY